MCLKAEVKQHSISLKQDKRGPGSKLAITANRSLSEIVRTQNEKKEQPSNKSTGNHGSQNMSMCRLTVWTT